MISNITNALPTILKDIKEKKDYRTEYDQHYDFLESIKFYSSILPKHKSLDCLKHLYIDMVFHINNHEVLENFQLSLDSFPFLKEFEFIINFTENYLIVRSNYEEFALLSLMMLGSLKNIEKETADFKGIFLSVSQHFLTYCIKNGYNACKEEDLEIFKKFNKGFEEEMFSEVMIIPTPEKFVGTIHFVGVELNKDILCIFEKYKNVKFSYNEETASFIITMAGQDWDNFWENAPDYLKKEFSEE